MARHRSPRGRTALPRLTAPAPRHRRSLAGDAVRSTTGRIKYGSQIRYGASVAVAAGGMFSVLAAAVPAPGDDTPDPATAAASFGVSSPGVGSPEADPAQAAPETGRQEAAQPAATGAGIAALTSVPGLTDAVRDAGAKADEAVRRRAEADAEQARAAEAQRARAQTSQATSSARATASASGITSCGMPTASLGGVKPWVSAAVEFLGCQFGKPQTLGVGSRSGTSDHPSGLAADFMVDRRTGDALAQCALDNRQALGITYVIWQQRINFGSGWRAMEDRGSPTANHMDHVHVSFATSAPGGRANVC